MAHLRGCLPKLEIPPLGHDIDLLFVFDQLGRATGHGARIYESPFSIIMDPRLNQIDPPTGILVRLRNAILPLEQRCYSLTVTTIR